MDGVRVLAEAWMQQSSDDKPGLLLGTLRARLSMDLGQEYCSHCGYCDPQDCSNARTAVHRGFVVNNLSPRVYQRLLDLGWRRSGTLMYTPVMDKTCCQLQSIRYLEGECVAC